MCKSPVTTDAVYGENDVVGVRTVRLRLLASVSVYWLPEDQQRGTLMKIIWSILYAPIIYWPINCERSYEKKTQVSRQVKSQSPLYSSSHSTPSQQQF